jgi:hypothetical protein
VVNYLKTSSILLIDYSHITNGCFWFLYLKNEKTSQKTSLKNMRKTVRQKSLKHKNCGNKSEQTV